LERKTYKLNTHRVNLFHVQALFSNAVILLQEFYFFSYIDKRRRYSNSI